MNKRGKPIESLVGEELSAVSFVRDYVEFHFDGPLIRALNNPIANIGGKAFPFPKAGSRDALCSFVGKAVIRVKFKGHVELSLAFDDGQITIPLDNASYRGPESFHWCPADGPMEVNQ
jgi:hypothetical protein